MATVLFDTTNARPGTLLDIPAESVESSMVKFFYSFHLIFNTSIKNNAMDVNIGGEMYLYSRQLFTVDNSRF